MNESDVENTKIFLGTVGEWLDSCYVLADSVNSMVDRGGTSKELFNPSRSETWQKVLTAVQKLSLVKYNMENPDQVKQNLTKSRI